MPPKFAPRKLLVAAVGVATLNYLAVACTPSPPTSGNLPAPTAEPDSGLPPPPSATVVPTSPPPTSGNLPAPQPVEPTLPDASTPTTTTTAPSSSVSPVPTGSNKNVKPPFKPPRPPTAGNLMMPSGNQNK